MIHLVISSFKKKNNEYRNGILKFEIRFCFSKLVYKMFLYLNYLKIKSKIFFLILKPF